MVNSKKKGNRFEREVAKKLNEIFEGYIRGEFKRTPSSGAYLGGVNAEKNKDLSREAKRTLTSDLIVPENFKYAVEIKSYKDIDLYGLLTGNKSKIYDWIDEVEETVGNEFDGWIIISKRNRGKWIVIFEHTGEFRIVEKDLRFRYGIKVYCIMSFEDFFKYNELERFLKE